MLSRWLKGLERLWANRPTAESPLMMARTGSAMVQKDYSPAMQPAEATPEIAAHNQAIEQEYQAEVDRRKAAFERGEYQPRHMYALEDTPDVYDQVAWDLEMSRADLLPGRRADVTRESGRPRLQAWPLEDILKQAEIDRVQRRVTASELAIGMGAAAADIPQRVYDFIGVADHDDLVRQTGGPELADRVFKEAQDLLRKMP
jgi:hypothetical protein